jgi:hypothetical protein
MRPILFLSLVEQNLQTTNPEARQPNAKKSILPISSLLRYGGSSRKLFTHKDRCDPYRKINVEDPSPRIVIREPAAQGWPK